MQMLFGNEVAEELIAQQLKEHNNNWEKVITVLSNISEPIKSDNPSPGILHEKIIKHLEAISDPIQKSNQILTLACRYAKEQKTREFVELLDRYHGSYNIAQEFTFNGYAYDLARHLIGPLTSNVAALRYLLGSKVRKEMTEELVTKALNHGIMMQHDDAIRAIMAYQSLDANKRTLREYAKKCNEQKAEIELFIDYMYKHLTNEEITITMKSLIKVMKLMIKDRRILSDDLLNLIWLYDKDQIWSDLIGKFEELLNMDTLNSSPCDWEWINYHILENRNTFLWLDDMPTISTSIKNSVITNTTNHTNFSETREYKSMDDLNEYSETKHNNNNNNNNSVAIRWHKIAEICEKEMIREHLKLQLEMKTEIEKNEEMFQRLTLFDCTHLIDKIYLGQNARKMWRQDVPRGGLTCQLDIKELEKLSYKSTNYSWDAVYSYDYDIYAAELLQRANALDEPFHKQMKDIFSKIKCEYTRGPVKTHDRCKMKAQLEYDDEKFPKSAHVIDVVRCSVSFDSIENYYHGLLHFVKTVVHKNDRFEIMRCKNGFDIKTLHDEKTHTEMYSTKLKIPIPDSYKDVKINIIFKRNKNKSIVGEVQFLLKAMSASKSRQHKFYEITRQRDFMEQSYRQCNLFNFEFQLKLAGFNETRLSRMILHYPLEFGRCDYILKKVDTEGKNFIDNMAYNPNLQYQNAKELLQSLIPEEKVQGLLVGPDINSLMWALWKQHKFETILLFVPKNATDQFWHVTDWCEKNLLHWAMRNDKVNCLTLLKWLKERINSEKWAQFIVTQETMQGYTPLLTLTFFQPYITDEMMLYLIPSDYSTNVDFWSKSMFLFHQFHAGCSLLHFAVKNVRPNALARLKILQKYMIPATWETLLASCDGEGRTPLMLALQLNPEMSEEMMNILIPQVCKSGQDTFWKTLSRDENTIIHLCIMNTTGNEIKRLEYLKQAIPSNIWNFLLFKKNASIFQEFPEETALRLEKPKQMVQLLQPKFNRQK